MYFLTITTSNFLLYFILLLKGRSCVHVQKKIHYIKIRELLMKQHEDVFAHFLRQNLGNVFTHALKSTHRNSILITFDTAAIWNVV